MRTILLPNPHTLTTLPLPHAHIFVKRPRDQLAMRQLAQTRHRVRMAHQRPDLPSRGQVPDAYRLVLAAAGQDAGRGHAEGAHRATSLKQ